jgi:amino acid transporter
VHTKPKEPRDQATPVPAPDGGPIQQESGHRKPLPQGGGYAAKRFLLGRPIPTAHLIHERLGKLTALAVFSSDALSSVAYATEEMLRTLFIGGAVAAAAFAVIMPLSLVIVSVLAILMFSYRQTIRAYPSAGGAYIVTKDNFGLIPAQVAGVALLTDYILTVAVSTSAGVAAIIAAVPGTAGLRVPLAVGFIALIALGNLRGVKESGRIFAMPTYVFIAMVFSLLGISFVRMLTGSLHPVASGLFLHQWAKEGTTSGLFALSVVPLSLALHALASGSTAMTGVEAISNGVPAFKPPEWKNARTTLMAMGATLGTMFLGISFLAKHLQVVPDPHSNTTVLAEIGRAVFGGGAFGHVLFYVLQTATTLVLVLAANTAFADFPRLANFHASDNFLPRQFTTRGHRLVYSNGIIALAVAAAAIVAAFGADVTRLIPFYAIGVFTSFTLSQAGMARRHLRLREKGWKVGIAVNGMGSVATLIILAIIAWEKFFQGAWAVIVLVPVLVTLLVRMAHQYEREEGELERDLDSFTVDTLRPMPVTLLLVDDIDAKTIHALQYAKTIRADDIRAVHVEDDPLKTLELETAWSSAGLDEIPLKVIRGHGDGASRLAGFVAAMPEDRDVNVLVPVAHESSATERLSDGRVGTRLTRALLPYEKVRVTLVRDHPDGVHPLSFDDHGRPVVKFAPRGTHTVVIMVDTIDRAVLGAVTYALTLGATEIRAVHAAVDPDAAMRLAQRWMDHHIPVQLDVIECWDRNIPRALEHYVLERADRGAEVTAVMPRRDFPKFRQRMLHDRTSRKIGKALGRYAHIDVAAVPFYFAPKPRVAERASGAERGLR